MASAFVLRFRDTTSGCGDERWRSSSQRWAVFLSPASVLLFFVRTIDEIELTLGSLSGPDQPIPTSESWTGRRESG